MDSVINGVIKPLYDRVLSPIAGQIVTQIVRPLTEPVLKRTVTPITNATFDALVAKLKDGVVRPTSDAVKDTATTQIWNRLETQWAPSMLQQQATRCVCPRWYDDKKRVQLGVVSYMASLVLILLLGLLL
jgi:hypothetical protein